MKMLGQKLKYREVKKLTTRELGKMVNVAHVTISKYELGKAQPRPKVLQKLADSLDVPLEKITKTDDRLGKIVSTSFSQEEFKRLMQEAEKLPINLKITISDVVKTFLKFQKFQEAKELTKDL